MKDQNLSPWYSWECIRYWPCNVYMNLINFYKVCCLKTHWRKIILWEYRVQIYFCNRNFVSLQCMYNDQFFKCSHLKNNFMPRHCYTVFKFRTIVNVYLENPDQQGRRKRKWTSWFCYFCNIVIVVNKQILRQYHHSELYFLYNINHNAVQKVVVYIFRHCITVWNSVLFVRLCKF